VFSEARKGSGGDGDTIVALLRPAVRTLLCRCLMGKLDEETFGTNEALRMMFKIAQNPNLSIEKKMTNREIGLRKLTSQRLQAGVVGRIVAWMKNGRLGR
jgi:hypothetical protein